MRALRLAVGLLCGLAASVYADNPGDFIEAGDYQAAIAAYYEHLGEKPEDRNAWRGLGLAFYLNNQFDMAIDALNQANTIKPDPEAYLYLGMTFERMDRSDDAINAYGQSLALRDGGRTADLVRARLDNLVYERIAREAATAIEQETALDAASLPEQSIAVMPFDVTALPDELQPLSYGLAELTAIDLAKVQSLTVVDRLKIETLLNELELASTDLVQSASAPRVGRLVGSSRIVTGAMTDLGDRRLRINSTIVDVRDDSSEPTEAAEGSTQQFFTLQKALVFGIIDELGIELTADERNAISEVPTENFLAFLAYSRGLEQRALNRFSDAQASFREAATLDRNFTIADNAARSSEVAAAGGVEPTLGSFQETVLATASASISPGSGLDNQLFQLSRRNPIIPGGVNLPNPAERRPTTRGTQTVTVRAKVE